MPSMTLNVPANSEMHRQLVRQLQPRIMQAEKANQKQHDKWKSAEEQILAYVPESQLDAKRASRRANGEPVYTTIHIPYTYALVMAAHTYWTSVFFARSPIHQFMGNHGEGEQQTQALEALINYQISFGGATGPYYIWLYDAAKYGVGIAGLFWDREDIRYSSIEASPTGGKTLVTRQGVGYEGNRVYNVSPFDFCPDPRVTIGQFQSGEYLAVRKRIPWNSIIRRAKQGYYMNVDLLPKFCGNTDPTEESRSALERPEGFSGEGSSLPHPAVVEAWEVYVDLIPKEWKLGTSDFPEKYVFTITKDYKLIFGCQPLGALHNKFPFDVLEPEVEAYGQYNRGIPEIMSPIQNTMNWLINTHFFNTRAILNNLFLVDPTKVVMKDFENSEPGGYIRLKPEAYGTDLRTFFHQIPITDVTQSNFTDLNVMQMIGERVLGVNDQIMGALGSGGRKTATEVRTSTGFGVNRLKTISEYMSATGFSSHAQKLVANSQQYYSAEKKFRIAGSLAMEAGSPFVAVTPDDIAGSYSIVPVDGTLPVDRMAQVNLWKEILVGIGRIPQIGMQYDLGRIFAWMANLAGLKNINQFKLAPQILPPGAAPPPGTVPVAPGAMSNTRMGGIPSPTAEMPEIMQ